MIAAQKEPILIGWQSDPTIITGSHGPELMQVVSRYTAAGHTVRARGADGEFITYKPFRAKSGDGGTAG